jgi:hypothetical protein
VRLNGRVFEAVQACRQRRGRLDLYHSALEVQLPEARYVIETAPVRDDAGVARGVVGEGPVGSRQLASLRTFRYELRCWREGLIPDVDEAVEGPQRLTADPAQPRRLLELVGLVPLPVWGRDELGAGEMWNSNSVTAWLLARAGLPADRIGPPAGGSAPGWSAGVVVARRHPLAQRPLPARRIVRLG